jgi:hypothetical protein
MHEETNAAPVSQGAQENESVYVIFCGRPITICGYALSPEEAIGICAEHNAMYPYAPRYEYLKISRLHDTPRR